MGKNNQEQTADTFRLAMRKFAATVSIISTITESNSRHGMAATAVTSLSFEPLSLLIAVNKSASMHEPLGNAQKFCVNVLQTSQTEQCEVFSNGEKRQQRFEIGDWREGKAKLPYLFDAQANIFCSVGQSIDAGSHSAFIGLVEEVRVRNSVNPLIYLDGSFLKYQNSSIQLPQKTKSDTQSSKNGLQTLEGLDWLW